ncbi:hypothetical protein KJ359_012345 [Pestalotiopsis sp. 9143b]|nr:hypothetical protein KJ359_012345 [Pestalotiopsis sp. 9143b]
MTSQAPTDSSSVHVIQTTESYNELLKSHKYVAVDFHASWCGPCKAMSPLFEKFAAEHAAQGSVAFAKVDVDEVPDVAARYRVTSIPTFMFIKDGREYEEVKSANPPKLKTAVDEMIAELSKATAGAADDKNDVAKAIQDEKW